MRIKKRKNLVIHIGHPKTGTSTIQKILVKNKDTINRLGIIYPDFGQKYNAHHLLVNSLISHKRDNFLPKSDVTGSQVVEELKNLAKNRCVDTVILSSEAFVWALGFKPAFEELEAAFEIHIVWIVRSPTEYANSMANQLIKMGFFQQGITLSHVIREAINLADYAENARAWRDRFPNARFSVASMADGFDAWEFFCDEVNPSLRQLERPEENSNVSLPPEALAFLLRLQAQERSRSNAESSRIMSMLDQYTKTANIYPRNVTVIPPDAQAALLKKFENTGSEVAKMFPGFDPKGLEPRERQFVDLAAIPAEYVMQVYDFCMEQYNGYIDFLRR
ncbi:hypothetical protein ACFOW6_13475 [Fodinicurvata halophila]|uniref:Sulfotransferase family protein n=1 Tax=Fodinicurvata halophila TaxID=1419723 RepID=A0ABV8UP57_9PROT